MEGIVLKCFCALMIIGVTVAWDPNFCESYNDFDSFPHPGSCQDYLICWQGELFEMSCPVGENYDPIEGVCDYADRVECDSGPKTTPKITPTRAPTRSPIPIPTRTPNRIPTPSRSPIPIPTRIPTPDFNGCPPASSSKAVFLAGDDCDEYYICIGGNPVLLRCRPGQHWNVYEGEICKTSPSSLND